MFNPARLKVQAMKREMPKRYWRNLPEAQDIDVLIRAAATRTEDMVAAEPTKSRKRAGAAHAKIAPDDLPDRLASVAEHVVAPKLPARGAGMPRLPALEKCDPGGAR